MATQNARFLGYDPAGDAVFQDLAYPSDGPKSWIAGTSFPQLDSPDVFRMSRETAERTYGKAYAAVDELHPQLSRRNALSELEVAAAFDRWFGMAASADDGLEDRRELIERTKEFLTRATERAAEDREAELAQRQIIRESAAFHGDWVPGNPAEDQRHQLGDDHVRRQEWNELIEKRSLDESQQKSISEMTREEIVTEARLVHAHLSQLNESLEKFDGAERARLREEMKPFAKRENELREEYLSRRKAEALGGPSREQTIRILRAFARDRAQEDYAVPEVAIARNMANQLEAGAKEIDLSQRYWTTNPAEAEDRHQRALEYLEKHLGPVLRQAEKQTERLD